MRAGGRDADGAGTRGPPVCRGGGGGGAAVRCDCGAAAPPPHIHQAAPSRQGEPLEQGWASNSVSVSSSLSNSLKLRLSLSDRLSRAGPQTVSVSVSSSLSNSLKLRLSLSDRLSDRTAGSCPCLVQGCLRAPHKVRSLQRGFPASIFTAVVQGVDEEGNGLQRTSPGTLHMHTHTYSIYNTNADIHTGASGMHADICIHAFIHTCVRHAYMHPPLWKSTPWLPPVLARARTQLPIHPGCRRLPPPSAGRAAPGAGRECQGRAQRVGRPAAAGAPAGRRQPGGRHQAGGGRPRGDWHCGVGLPPRSGGQAASGSHTAAGASPHPLALAPPSASCPLAPCMHTHAQWRLLLHTYVHTHTSSSTQSPQLPSPPLTLMHALCTVEHVRVATCGARGRPHCSRSVGWPCAAVGGGGRCPAYDRG